MSKSVAFKFERAVSSANCLDVGAGGVFSKGFWYLGAMDCSLFVVLPTRMDEVGPVIKC